jgi:hypothetical protein
MRTAARAIVTSLLVTAACGNSERGRLERGVAFAKKRFIEANRNPVAAISLGTVGEMGSTLSSYVAAGMPENADLPRIQDDRATEPWTVVVRAAGDGKVIIEGFGRTLERPILAETVLVKPVSRP